MQYKCADFYPYSKLLNNSILFLYVYQLINHFIKDNISEILNEQVNLIKQISKKIIIQNNLKEIVMSNLSYLQNEKLVIVLNDIKNSINLVNTVLIQTK